MCKIIVVGLGPGRHKYISSKTWKHLNSGRPLFFRTLKPPAARNFASCKNVRSFDYLIDQSIDSEQVCRTIARRLIRSAMLYGPICYAVSGDPLIGEATVDMLRETAPRSGVELKILPGPPFIEPLLKNLEINLQEGITACDALVLDRVKEPGRNHFMITQVYNSELAGRVKKVLKELYLPEHSVTVIKSSGMEKKRFLKLPLKDLDRFSIHGPNTTIYMSPFEDYSIGSLMEVMARLRAEDGCPWDREQTNHSLRQYLIEESYEVIAAIDALDDTSLREELGDVLLQVVFHSQIASEENRFDFSQVVNDIAAKLIRRHPHVFGKENAADPDQVKLLWEQIKSDERNERSKSDVQHKKNDKRSSGGSLKDKIFVDHALPALLKSYKLQKKAAEVGFDWPCVEGPLEKVREELDELAEAYRAGDQASIEEELGDYLFTVVNISRFLKVNPELALGKTIDKFIERFQYVLEQAEKTGCPISSFSLERLDEWWEEAKKIGKNA